MLHYVAVCSIMLHYVAVCCSMLHYVAACCSMSQCIPLYCCILPLPELEPSCSHSHPIRHYYQLYQLLPLPSHTPVLPTVPTGSNTQCITFLSGFTFTNLHQPRVGTRCKCNRLHTSVVAIGLTEPLPASNQMQS